MVPHGNVYDMILSHLAGRELHVHVSVQLNHGCRRLAIDDVHSQSMIKKTDQFQNLFEFL